MLKSDSIGKLSAALVAAQAELKHAVINKTNPHFKARYADLQSVIDASKPILQKNGLTIVQLAGADGDYAKVTTMVLHASGEYIGSELSLRPTKPDAQGMGSALTYGRRYGWSAICGIAADEDDDGNGASAQQPTPQAPRRETPQQPKEAPKADEGRQAFTTALCDWTGLKMTDKAKLLTAASAIAAVCGLGKVSDNYEKATATIKQLKAEGKKVVEITPKENA